jgi:cytochrome c553
MINGHSAPEHMKQKIIVMIACVMTVIGCTGKHAEGQMDRSMTDSARVVDSTLQSAIAQRVRRISYEEQQGGFLYNRYCVVCHGQEGKGDGFNAFNLDPRPRDLSDSTYMRALSDDQIFQTISGGGRSVNKSTLMPAYGWTLNRQQIRDLSSYVRTFMSLDR